MIPVSLALRNFLSYGEDAPTLDFTGFQIACVTGRNGHGKSALFDAMTWALWGEARKASSDRKPDEGLLRIGATDLRVEFVFDLDGQRFRVCRAFRKTARSGSSSLELQVFDPSTDRYRTLSESGSIRKTQTRIDNLIRISYNTFVNSAFILQGRVDEFTRRSPSDRKAILSDILELSRYDALGVRAREHARENEANALRTRDQMTRIEEAAVKRTDLRQQLKEARLALEAAEKESTAGEQELERCHKQIAETEARRDRRAVLTSEHDGMRHRLKEVSAELESASQKAQSCQEALKSQDQIRADAMKLKHLRRKETLHRARQTELHVLEVDRTRLEADLVVARLKVETCQQHWSTVASDLRRQITDGDTALGGRPEIKKALLELVDLRMKDRDLIALRDKKEAVERQRRDLELSFNRQRSEIQVEIETRKSRRRDLQSLLDHRTELDRTFNDARQHLETFRALNEEMERVKREGTESQQTEDRLKERLEDLGQRRQQWVAQATQLKDHDDPDCPLCGSELDENHRLEVLAQLGKEMEELSWEHKAVTRNLTDAKGRRDACRSAYQKLRDQVHPLGDAPRKFAQAEAALAQVSKVDEDLEMLVGGIQELEDRAKTFEASSDIAVELSQIRERIERLSAETRQHDAVRTRIETLAPAELESVKLDEIQSQVDAVRAQLPEAERKYLAATEWLEEKRYASGIQKHLAELSAKAEAIDYDNEAHDATLKLIENLTGSEKELDALQDAERDLAVARTKMEAADIRRNEIVVAMRDAEEALLQFRDIDETREMLSGHKDRLSTQLTEFRSSRDSALREVATLERDEEACLQLEAQREDTSTQLARFEKDATLYRELVKAFGRDGIQALMIDQAIPELQDEANRILSRLTANGTQITLESLSELKSGGTRETLDIRISDELGERKYELYSGGEAFRVDFAIRIALSKLLARRSGTPLQTLVIDEGFGTQDEEGLTHLIEAIQTISDEFEKVLVITHLDVIKNAFPVRIEVVKHADSGSTFTVVS